jgi:hypothetical protein
VARNCSPGSNRPCHCRDLYGICLFQSTEARTHIVQTLRDYDRIYSSVGLAQISDAAQQEAITLSTVEQIQDEFGSVACDSGKRLDAVKALFERMGASPSALSIEKLSSIENVIVRHEGMSAETIVIGAHYDLAELGCGAVDNWTGIVAIAHVYRSIQNFKGRRR